MTEIARELLEDVEIGAYVKITYGTDNNQETFEGVINKLSENFLWLKKDDGTASKIRLDDSLRALNVIRHTTEPDVKETIRTAEYQPKTTVPAGKPASVTTLPIVQPTVPKKYSVQRKMTSLALADPYVFNVAESIEAVKKDVKGSDNTDFRKTINAILDAVHHAFRSKEVKYKYHDLRARIMRSWDMCDSAEDFRAFYCALGILAVIAQDYRFAIEPLVRGKKYIWASYAAAKGKMKEESQIYLLCAVLSGEHNEINQYVAETCVSYKETAALKVLLERSKDDAVLCEKIAACAYKVFSASGAKLDSDITPYFSAYDTAKKLLDSVPKFWQSQKSALAYWEEFKQYKYPMIKTDGIVVPKIIIGKITKYTPEKWGFISQSNYFYINQVRDDTEEGILLRKMLYVGLYDNLEVSYYMGISPIKEGQTAAYSIELTKNGYADAINRITSEDVSKTQQKGFVEHFDTFSYNGIIQSKGKKYKFRLSDIMDPWLKVYYANSFSAKEQDVVFNPQGIYAHEICWSDPDDNDRDLYASLVKPDEITSWETYQVGKKSALDPVTLPDVDPYADYYYSDLPAVGSNTDYSDIPPLTWGEKPLSDIGTSAKKDSNHKDKIGASLTHDSGYYAERANKAMIAGRYEIAEMNYENALQVGGFNEATVCNYINLCLRQDGNIDKAIQLIEKYQNNLSTEKLLNIKIQVYEKKKDYAALPALYEQAYRATYSVSRKSHSLSQLINTYIKLAKYNDALECCKRWHSFFNQNKFSPDADKLKKVSSYINRQEAVCRYHLGQMDEARRIATDLVRENPNDAIANSILNGTLVEDDSNAIDISEGLDPEIMEFDFDDDTFMDSVYPITRFVSNLIQQADLASSLKSPNIKDGKYIGSAKEGFEDVRTLVNKTRLSSKMRSETLLAACKVLEQIAQRDDYTSKNESYKYILAGRAMASWGDYMVSQANQLDTTRMAYLYAIKVLAPSGRINEQSWINSYNRYFKSYFIAKTGSNSLEEYITIQTNSREKDGLNTDIFASNKIQDVLLSEFLVGVLMFINTTDKQPDRIRLLINDLYNKSTGLRNSVCHQLEVFLNDSLPEQISLEEFRKSVLKAAKTLMDETELLNKVIVNLSNALLSKRLPDNLLSGIDAENWKNYLTATDLKRLKSISYIVIRSQDYFNRGDFELRADCLRAIFNETNELRKSINEEPTDVSYDIFLPALEQIALKVTDKQTELYHDFLPKITLSEKIPPFRTPDGLVQIQLTVENEINYQSADSFVIESVSGRDVTRFEATMCQTVRGGDKVEISLLVSLNDSALSTGSFTVTIVYSYKCSDAPQNVITRNQEQEFTFIIPNRDINPLLNPFAPYEGKVMDKEEMFLGRSEQINIMLNIICPDANGAMNYGRAIAMYGQTRTGKSSLMYHLKKKLENEKYRNNILIWDIGNIGELPESDEYMANFLYNLLFIGNEAIYDNESFCVTAQKENLFPPLEEIKNDPNFAFSYFTTYMKRLNSVLKKDHKIIVLFVDEFTYLHSYIKEGKIPASFMRFWKALLQDYCIFAIVAGQDDMPEFMREYKNEFACMELLKLTYLEERYAKLLIRQPLEKANNRSGIFNDDGSVDLIYELTAGSAYLIILLCSKLVAYLNEKGAHTVTTGILEAFLRDKAFGANGFLTEVHFEPQIQERGHSELDGINAAILLSIARLSRTTGYADITDVECAYLSREDIRKYADRLVDRNVLEKEGRDGYRIQVKLLERWLIKDKGE